MKKIFFLILFILFILIASTMTSAFIAGSQDTIYHFRYCDQANITVFGSEEIVPAEYFLGPDCQNTTLTTWTCDCSRNYNLKLTTNILTRNNYTFEINYTYTRNVRTPNIDYDVLYRVIINETNTTEVEIEAPIGDNFDLNNDSDLVDNDEFEDRDLIQEEPTEEITPNLITGQVTGGLLTGENKEWTIGIITFIAVVLLLVLFANFGKLKRFFNKKKSLKKTVRKTVNKKLVKKILKK